MEQEKKLTSADLNRSLGRKELYSIAFGHVIGSGVFSLIGVAIGMTGKSVFIALLISAVLVIMQSLPLILLSGTARFRGGMYSMVSSMLGEKFAGFYVIIFFLANISLAMYAISFAQYLQNIFPSVPITLVSLIVLIFFFVVNLLGIENAAKLEFVMIIVMALALALFVVYGLPQVDYTEFFNGEGFMTRGVYGLLAAGTLLTWATAGGIDMVNLSAECKNPTRDLPQVIVVTTAAIAIFYALIGVVAAGILPLEDVIDQPLGVVAAVILPRPLYLFFVFGGALLALATTLNASFAWVTKPILQACNDGWIPKQLGYIHPKTKTPIIILSVFFVIGLGPILFGFDIGLIADISVILNNLLSVLVCLGVMFLPKRLPELWEKSAFHCGKGKLVVYSLLGAFGSGLAVVLLMMDAGKVQFIGMIIIAVAAFLYAFLRYKSGNVDMQDSVEEA